MTSCCQTSLLKNSLTIALAGNPNCGKTTLFNKLTGSRQKVGNWPGVTVERKGGYFTEEQTSVQVVDLPGVYSLTLTSETGALDERIACDFILQQEVDVVINIVDASHLERHLYLTTQLIEMGVPLILVLNMMDIAEARQIHIDAAVLSKALGCPVIALDAKKGQGLSALKQAILSYDATNQTAPVLPYPDAIQESIQALSATILPSLNLSTEWLALRLLEGDTYARRLIGYNVSERVSAYQSRIKQSTGEDADILLADTRYRFIQQLMAASLTSQLATLPTWTSRIDNIVLNRVLALPIFLGVMYLLFVFAINVGGAFQDFFDMGSQVIFVDGLGHWLAGIGAPSWLIAVLANGIGKGINTTLAFIPVLGAMFLFLALLEDSGYMARAAFVIDRLMRTLGLPGKAFVPMIVGFGCNVPAVMGARTLENRRDRILTIMMSPFMSCGARLAIFAVFVAAFFPQGGQNIVFALYLTGILMAVLTGYLLRGTVLKGRPSPLVMELPLYHAPHMKTVLLSAWHRLYAFIFRAGRLIVPICVLIGALNAINLDGSINTGDGDARSLLSVLGQWITPIFSPMGIKPDNWPATVGLVTGILAKEVVVGTLNSLYTQVGHLTAAAGAESFQFWAGLQEAALSIPRNLAGLGGALANPVAAEAQSVNQGVYGLMYQRFDGQTGAFAYLLFVLLYFPCISTMAVMLRELHKGWAIFSALWMTGVAYGAAVVFYQAATWTRHPFSSSLWIMAVTILFFAVILSISGYARHEQKQTRIEILPAGETT